MATEASLILFNVIAATIGGLVGGMLGYRAGKIASTQGAQGQADLNLSISQYLFTITQNTDAARELLAQGAPSHEVILILLDELRAPLVETTQRLQAENIQTQQYFRPALSGLSVEDQISVYTQLQALYTTATAILRAGYTIPYSALTQQLLLRVLALGETTLLEEFSGSRQRSQAALQKFNNILSTLIQLKGATSDQKLTFENQVQTILQTDRHFGETWNPTRDEALGLIQTAMRSAGIL